MAEIRWDVLDAWLHIMGWSDRRFAKELHYSPAHLCALRKGDRPISMHVADRMVEVTRFSYDRLLRHPSVKPQPGVDPRIGLTHTESGAKHPRLCRDPEHFRDEYEGSFTRREREASTLMPRQTRKRLWPVAWWKRG